MISYTDKTNLMQPLDLTLEISAKLPSFPGSPEPRFISWATKEDDGYNLELIFLSSHSGTHIDAPFHFVENGSKVDKIPLGRFVANAVLCKIKRSANEAITRQDIIDFENKHGKLQTNATLIFATGWHKNLFKKYYFTKNPGLSVAAAKYLVKKKINLVGIDSPSIDLGSDSRFLAHHQLLNNNIIILENLCNLEKISSVNFKLIVLPLKLKGATGSPVRAIAL